ncbi:cell wall-active antibiotics response protein LiaF [Thalassobacillus pellis]|uniref:cell wall-active antibiotics response protein LiaF n=1 Tax=Thalassobacillus pellis TaxID=748008 RepID=UPI001960CF39|nr:cell wall-active antibiotics response protein LiaF [Thalassobacillus pellis]MBM7551924.1 lia operon protein LiaF [Thalassobacillus pellis]
MLQKMKTDTLNWLIIIGVLLFVIEVAFFHGGLIFSVVFSGLFIYLGWKRYAKLWGKVLFWIGLITLIITILNMIAVRFLLIAGVVMFLLHYSRSKKNPQYIRPEWTEGNPPCKESVFKKEPLFQQKFFGDQQTADTAYQWNDINIHGGFGDRVIDLSNTVLPEDTAVISIRHMIGSIVVYVPYEVEVSIHHGAIFGRANIFGHQHLRLMNQTVSYQTEGYAKNKPRVKIITTMLSGDFEVKRV